MTARGMELEKGAPTAGLQLFHYICLKGKLRKQNCMLAFLQLLLSIFLARVWESVGER